MSNAIPMTELILVRHGITPWNRERRFQGQIDIPLSDEGVQQAQRTGRRLASLPLAAVYSSDLARARQTAEPIAASRSLALQFEPGLRERHYGGFEGLTRDELLRDHADAFRRWREREPDFQLPGAGGETLRQFYQRVEATLRALAARHAGETIVAVTHGGVLDCAYRVATGLGLSAQRDFDLFNASVNRIGWDGGAFRLLGWGEVGHLNEAVDDVEARLAR
ncbi:MAG: histidine phosphatase family protein [Burkholderiaceae bacterium]